MFLYLPHRGGAYNPKYQIWCESDVPCAQDPTIPVWFIWEVPDPVDL